MDVSNQKEKKSTYQDSSFQTYVISFQNNCSLFRTIWKTHSYFEHYFLNVEGKHLLYWVLWWYLQVVCPISLYGIYWFQIGNSSVAGILVKSIPFISANLFQENSGTIRLGKESMVLSSCQRAWHHMCKQTTRNWIHLLTITEQALNLVIRNFIRHLNYTNKTSDGTVKTSFLQTFFTWPIL